MIPIDASAANSWPLGKLCYGIHLHIHAFFPYYIVYILLANLKPGMEPEKTLKIMLNLEHRKK